MFTVPVPNRIDAKLTAQVFDWDQFGKDRLMCECEMLFGTSHLESFAARNLTFTMKDHPQASLKARLYGSHSFWHANEPAVNYCLVLPHACLHKHLVQYLMLAKMSLEAACQLLNDLAPMQAQSAQRF